MFIKLSVLLVIVFINTVILMEQQRQYLYATSVVVSVRDFFSQHGDTSPAIVVYSDNIVDFVEKCWNMCLPHIERQIIYNPTDAANKFSWGILSTEIRGHQMGYT